MQRVKSWPGVPAAAAVRSVLLIFLCLLFLSILFRLIFVHTLHLIHFTHLSKFLCNNNNNAVIAVCVAFADTHTYTYSRRPRIVCMYACVLCEVQLRRSSSLSLCLSHSTLTPFRLFLLSSLPFLHLISFCTKGVARPLLLLFCIHTRTLTLKCTRRTVAASQCT